MKKIENLNEYRKSEEARLLWQLYSDVSDTLDRMERSRRSSSFDSCEYETIVNEIIMFHSKIENWLVRGGYAHFAE